MKKVISVLLVCVLALCMLSGCAKKETDLWGNATYKKDAELGKGGTAFTLDVTAGEKTVTFTVHTDKKTVGDALLEVKLVEGDAGPYGLYVKKVNGMEADYDKDQTYWAFYVNGEYAMNGVDATPISEGEKYGFVRSK